MELKIRNDKNVAKPITNGTATDTPDWLRSFKGCEHYSDSEAMAVLESLNSLAAVLLRNASQKLHVIDNQLVISLHQEETLQKLAA
jgi:hypothetical protein